MKRFLICLINLLLAFHINAREVLNPLDYGLKEARTGIERYEALYRCHNDAVKKGADISYVGIDSIFLEIPAKGKSIPLVRNTDFAGVVISVLHRQTKAFDLFSLTKKCVKIEVSKEQIDKGDFRKVNALCCGTKLLILKDDSLWVDNRAGFKYGHTRRDVMLLKNGRSQNKTIASYNTPETDPVAEYCEVDSEKTMIGNIIILRDPRCTQICRPFHIRYQNDVLLHDVRIETPESDLNGDRAIWIEHCANVTLSRITIRGTYSQTDNYGYGLSLDNLWNTRMEWIDGDSKWGCMGNNNLNNTTVANSIINRFDIHCYGRDVRLTDCTIRKSHRNWYCGGGSIMGTVKYERCHFCETSPYGFGSSYKTFFPTDVIFEDCVIEMSRKKNFIVGASDFSNNLNPRFPRKYLPNLRIKNMKVIVPDGMKKIYLYSIGKDSYQGQINDLLNISVNGLDVVSKSDSPVKLEVCDSKQIEKTKVRLKLKKVKYNLK